VGRVGPAVVNDPLGKSHHQVDVLGLGRAGKRLDSQPPVVIIGEAKSTKQARTPGDLVRLERIRQLLITRGLDAEAARLVVFGREGFTADLVQAAAGRDDVHLVGLGALYQRPSG
jgi:hypothetical protein